MWDRTVEPSPADTARRRNPGPQILRSHALGRGTVFFIIEPRGPSRSMQQGRRITVFPSWNTYRFSGFRGQRSRTGACKRPSPSCRLRVLIGVKIYSSGARLVLTVTH